MFELGNILYTVISTLFIIVFCIVFRKVSERSRINILRVSAFLTLAFHLSILLYHYFNTPDRLIWHESSTMWPYYFCNFMMWFSFITFCGPKVLKSLYPFVLWGGFLGGMITIAHPSFYNVSAGIGDYSNLKSYISHSTMIFSLCFAIASGEYKPRIKTYWVFAAGMVFSMCWGIFSNWLYAATGKSPVNAMYLQAPAIDGTPFNGYVIGALCLLLVLVCTLIYEQLFIEKEERFITKSKYYFKKHLVK